MANIHTPAVSASPSGPDASSSSDLSPACQAGLLLSATQVARDVGIESTPTETIIEATGAGRTRAYEMRGRVLDQLSAMQRPPGRPSAPPEPPIEAELRAEICSQMLRYVRSHPGSISATSCSNSASTTSTSPSATSPKPSRSLPPPSPTGSAPPPPGPEPSPAPTGNNGDSGDNGDNGDNGDAGNDGNEGEPTRSGDAIMSTGNTRKSTAAGRIGFSRSTGVSILAEGHQKPVFPATYQGVLDRIEGLHPPDLTSSQAEVHQFASPPKTRLFEA